MKEKDVKTNIFPHTQAKLDLYKGYLEHYLRVLCNFDPIEQLHIFDIYCGAGIYDDGKKGSPLLAIDCIKNINEYITNRGKKIKPISIWVNDNDSERINNVKNIIEQQNISDITIQYFNKNANEMFDLVSNYISGCPNNHRNLIFIDPFGYSDIKKEKILNMLKDNYTEIILFLPVMHMYRFTDIALIDEEKPHYSNLRNFILSFFNDPNEVNTDKIFDYIESIKNAFSINGKYFTSSHYIEREKGNYYAMYFIGSNIYGLEKFIETKWALDPVKGKGFDQEDNSMQESLFEDELKEFDHLMAISHLEKVICETIHRKKILSNIDLYELTLRNGFQIKHANRILKKLLKENKIEETNNKKNDFNINYKNYKDKIIVSTFEVV